MTSTLDVSGAVALASTLEVSGVTSLNGGAAVTGTLSATDDFTMSKTAAALTHSGGTSLAISSSSGYITLAGSYVDVEDIRFTDLNIGISGTPNIIALASAGATLTGTLDVSGVTSLNGGAAVTGTLSATDDFTMSKTMAALTHTGGVSTDGLTITSSSGYVDVESVRFTDDAIGISTDADIITLTYEKVTVAGDLTMSGDTLKLTDDDPSLKHTGTGFLNIVSQNGGATLKADTGSYVDVQSVRFTTTADNTIAKIGLSGDDNIITLTDQLVTVSGAVSSTTLTSSGLTTAGSLDVDGVADISGDITLSGTGAQALTHSGSTGLSISSSGFVDVESVRFTSAAIGISTDLDLITLTANTVTVAGLVSSTTLTSSGVTTAGSLDVDGVADISGDITLSGTGGQALTHSGSTGLTITSTSGYVDVESVRFTDAQIGISGTANIIALATAGTTLTGTLDVSGVTSLNGGAAVTGTLSATGATTLTSAALSDDITMSKTLAALTHTGTGTTGLAITSTNGYVDVESIRFTAAQIGIAATPNIIALASAGATLTGTLDVSGNTVLSALLAVGGAHGDTSKQLYVTGDIYATVGLGRRIHLPVIHHM